MFRKKIWTKELNKWLFNHGSESPAELYRLFHEAFPDIETTVYGVTNHRSRIGACVRHGTNHESRAPKTLYSESIKHGYVYIKIAQPNVWISKGKWVWMETHPELYNTLKNDDQFVFLDGDNRNFNPNNIYRVPITEIGIINSKDGLIKGNPELNMMKIAKAKLKKASLDAGEKYGMVCNYGNGRKFKSEMNKKAREYQRKRRVIKNGNND